MSDDEMKKQIAELTKTLKEGERLLAPTRRPDGTLRKAQRVRAGYHPPDEVPKYKPKPALLNKEMGSAGPPGYDPDADARPKTKSVKRNERKKRQAAIEKDTNVEDGASEDAAKKESAEALSSLVNDLSVEDSTPQAQDVDKKIRALKKKIRLTEALEQKSAEQELNPEQLEKLAKLEDWRRELKQLEDQKTEEACHEQIV
ncbi:hypothetical protein PHAVU_002G251000 [Phaseolus vulgaris]|uniref:WIBG Mago-binding domain-containing protein n=1 Tax=Phaseolus vulgaris TaxID=3885 RepID=V7CN65_PHAVU|nr:hypothetical protein PHAVU_002G251000g [Phaseolus vulgaris]ESW31594.1 hypothetical protein PHAVU_002G251000g [Phaseolus vulgaris]